MNKFIKYIIQYFTIKNEDYSNEPILMLHFEDNQAKEEFMERMEELFGDLKSHGYHGNVIMEKRNIKSFGNVH